MTQQSLLPKFGAGKQETAELPVAEPESKAVSAPPVETKAISRAASEPTAANEKRTRVMTAVETEFPAANAAAPAPPPQAYPQGRWTLFRNPFGAATAKPKAGPAPVQGELSLDAVKPVRNDLSDSDLEVIRVSRPAPVAGTPAPVGPPAAAVELPESAGPVWDRLKTQFFGADKT
jgi:hypothetical protein